MSTTTTTTTTTKRTKTVLVAGANGYIGSAVCRAFVKAGWKTYGLVRNPKTTQDLALAEVIPVVGTFTDLSFLDRLYEEETKTFDVIVSTTEQVPGYLAHFKEILGLVRAVAATSKENGVKPLVLWTSGCKDYGMMHMGHGSPGLAPHTEESPLNAPPPILRERTENCVKIFNYKDEFDAVVLRPTTVYGYSSSYYGGILEYAASERAAGMDMLVIPGNPKSIMHGLHVDDAGEAYVSLAEHADRSAISGQAFNISGHRYETAQEVADALAREYGFSEGAKFVHPKEPYPPFPNGLHFVFSFSQWVSSEKLRGLTGWTDKRMLFCEGTHVYRLAFEATDRGMGSLDKARAKERIESVLTTQ
ncbi:hypothetical protein PT974_00915 [Cladobotryum mycophilum]|uniref:NAD-dependent epimerase/dehydratase domain-containing protein n=1 Tax=Cladobotryum mycophilum TaxID=491253 RepID=A0ABR0T3D3_9HYPO